VLIVESAIDRELFAQFVAFLLWIVHESTLGTEIMASATKGKCAKCHKVAMLRARSLATKASINTHKVFVLPMMQCLLYQPM